MQHQRQRKVLVLQKRFHDAFGLMKEAITLDDKNVYYFEFMAQVAEAIGDSDMLLSSLERLTTLKPERASTKWH